MQVLVTGAFGRLGRGVVDRLLSVGDSVVAFDVRSKRAERVAVKLAKAAKVSATQAGTGSSDALRIRWGDVRDASDIVAALQGCDAVIHCAGILSPASEMNPELAYAVNVTGTKHIIAACEAQHTPPRIVFASSLSVGGARGPDGDILRGSDPPVASDHYTSHKMDCEMLLHASSVPWVILRIGPSVSAEGMDGSDMGPDNLRLIFDIDPATKMEYVHPHDVATAMVNATRVPGVANKVLMIGGGPSCRLTFGEFNDRTFEAAGLGRFPRDAFGKTPFYSQWMDTTESQSLLQFQSRSFEDYLQEVRHHGRWRRPFVRLLSPLIRSWMLRHSEPWQGTGSITDSEEISRS